ncbi:pyrroline-5-carboxylate reductase [Phenylobacterium sp.]|uniref:pyrroline-5-carboxylate reductase n=1 Tax=Phenylobacterium sp. TaxID=1871053 RepID=UPI001200B944|nr:pyrroline-5-carboxylate reductase [Phenylobacterium sp.]THD64483.1 MAG: NADP oxidoreductase [Phenylobacterium sp.]
MTMGFVGCGAIASAMVEGLCARHPDSRIVVSPRNADRARDLAARFPNVGVAASNQAVLDQAQIVVLAIRPQVAAEAIADLTFRPDHRVLSLVAGLTLPNLRVAVAPANVATRAIPLPAVALNRGPTAIFPPDGPTRALFNTLGTAIDLQDEREFDVFATATATMANQFAFAETIVGWMTEQGVATVRARAFVDGMIGGLAATSAAQPNTSFADLAEAHQTPGGLNAQVLDKTTRDGAFAGLSAALDAVLARLRAGAAGCGI